MEPIEQSTMTTIKMVDIQEYLSETIGGIVTIIKKGGDYTNLTAAIIYHKLLSESRDPRYIVPNENTDYPIANFEVDAYINYLGNQVQRTFKKEEKIVVGHDHREGNNLDPLSKYRLFIRPEYEDDKSMWEKIRGIRQPVKIQSNIFYS